MFRILPRETVFFDLFERAAANAHQGAIQLVEFLERFDDLEERVKKIKDVEHAGDEITHETVDRLNSTFITPMDREDIHELICRLDDIVDLIDTAIQRIVIYKIAKPTDDAKQLAQCLFHATKIIVEMMPMMRNMKRADEVRQKCRDVHAQENEGDRIERHAIATLFEGPSDPIHVIKWKDVIEELESATDRCEDVANVIEGIVLKNV
jgi:predicted phosphate transport protein (TIGR00153 family)